MIDEGSRAPAFELETDVDGETVRLKDFAGKALVLFFYPKDSTPGCTREAQAFSESLAKFRKAGAEIVGVSKDSTKSHANFRAKYDLTVTLGSDPTLETHKAYGVWGEKTMYGKKILGTIRSTFVIGPTGKIVKAFRGVKVDGHAEAVLAAVKEIQGKAGTSKKK
ncbi:MAG: peroxiredoxin [Polyangiaceae bacterium]